MKRINHKSSAVLLLISIFIALLMVFSLGVCEERGEGDKILPLTGALEIEDAC